MKAILLALVLAAQACLADAPLSNEQRAARLAGLVRNTASETLKEFEPQQLKESELAFTVADLTTPTNFFKQSFRGEVPIYPASVVKLFYLEATHRWMQAGRIKDTPELRRALRDMTVDSSNDATHYVLDVLTGTASGPELAEKEMEAWAFKRNEVNRYFAGRSFTGINVNQKPWNDGPYGRDKVFVGAGFTNRNQLTTEATARLMVEIATHQSLDEKSCGEMMQLLSRDPFSKTSDPDDQAHGFIGMALPPGGKIWSKAGWTSSTRHDAAYVELPEGKRLVLVVFTTNHANERGIIHSVARRVFAGFASQ